MSCFCLQLPESGGDDGATISTQPHTANSIAAAPHRVSGGTGTERPSAGAAPVKYCSMNKVFATLGSVSGPKGS